MTGEFSADGQRRARIRKNIFAALLCAAPMLAQAPAFEVATIKESAPISPANFQSGKLRLGMNVDGARVDIGSLPLLTLVQIAFGVKPYQVSGPDWLREKRFDILAKIPEGVSKDQVPEMLKSLLIERFKLAVHHEQKDQPIYALVVGKNGPKLKESAPDADAPDTGKPDGPAISTPEGVVKVDARGRGATVTGGPRGPVRVSAGPNGTMSMEMSKVTMAGFADTLTPMVDRPVIDMTELKGTYQVTLEISMQEIMETVRSRAPDLASSLGGAAGGAFPNAPNTPTASDPSGGGSIFAKVQQLGLRLDARKSPVDVIVVDHIEKTPTDN